MSGFYWLASYPKSGNTWLRALLTSCLSGGGSIDINALDFAPTLSISRRQFDEIAGIASADLTEDEILAWRPAVLRAAAARAKAPLYAKTHDARLALPGGENLIPADATLGAVYVVRDPRDVAVSLAAHVDEPIDAAIERMADPDCRMARSPGRLHRNLVDCWSSWSRNAESWLDGPGIAPVLVRYEDLHADPVAVLTRTLPALGLEFSGAVVAAAVESSKLDRLRAQEQKSGFRERPGRAPFFGSGLAGGWRRILTAEQAARIEEVHAPMMRRLGYLGAA